MSTTVAKRKRARKACIPCHQRKRKCDAKYPCSMCVVYEYDCDYGRTNNDTNVSSDRTTTGSPPSVKRANVRVDADTSESTGIHEHRSRNAGSSVAMAFPHILSRALGSDNGPENLSKVPSFAYNFGIRPDEASNSHGSLKELISEDDLATYSEIYFSAIGSILDIIDRRIYAQRCKNYYEVSSDAGSTALTFGAVAAGIAAIGSFLSSKRHTQESDLVEYAKTILDDPASTRMLEADHIVAWAMRNIYLRATTRPNNAWIASCTAMHLCEVVGLHEEDSIRKIASAAGAAALGHDADRLRRIFWISWAGHSILAYECDRSPVHFRALTTQAIMSVSGSTADQFVRMAQIIPAPNSPFRLADQPRTQTEELSERLKALHEVEVTDPFLVVTRADIACCFYRRAYQLKMGISDDFTKLVIQIGNAAVEAARRLVRQGRFFWNVIGSVFHYVCVLLAMDTATASVHIEAAFKGLESIVTAADTGNAREALSMAQHLLSLHLSRRRKELADLEHVQADYQALQAGSASETATDMPDFGYGIDWDQFLLEPYISMFSGDL